LKNKFSGKFIVLDGPDGCGKSTQAKMLCAWLKAQGVEVDMFRDPGTTMIGEKIRQILLDPVHTSMGTHTEMLLYMAARAQLWKQNIAPSLAGGKCVVLDRWISSTCAYQGYAGGFGIENVIKNAGVCLERTWPDLTIILDVSLDTSSERMDRALDRMEQKGDDYHQKVREGFLKLPEIYEDIFTLDASDNVDAVHEKILELVKKRLT